VNQVPGKINVLDLKREQLACPCASFDGGGKQHPPHSLCFRHYAAHLIWRVANGFSLLRGSRWVVDFLPPKPPPENEAKCRDNVFERCRRKMLQFRLADPLIHPFRSNLINRILGPFRQKILPNIRMPRVVEGNEKQGIATVCSSPHPEPWFPYVFTSIDDPCLDEILRQNRP
jgi:hypothetical protein